MLLPQASSLNKTENSALLTDLYQLTMAYNYWQLKQTKQYACCQLFFRRHPFAGQYTIAAGLSAAIDYLQHWRFSSDDIDYLASLSWPTGKARFCQDFLLYLKQLRFTGQVHAVAEGSLVFPQQPLLRIEAPLIQAQILETPLMNAFSLASLVATKAHRISRAAEGQNVSEFGLRRAQGPNGGLTASRAAYLGGVDSTSNVLAGARYGIPVMGTMSHSWIMSFADEQQAFDAAAECMGSSCVLLVDTYDTIEGIKKAIITAEKMKKQSTKLAAIRLDSGDLAELSRTARSMLDQAGLTDTRIMVSGNIDEDVILSLKQQQAAIDSWGVGTRLATSHPQGALDLAYKLSAIKTAQTPWRYCYKKSDTASKTSLAGRIQIQRHIKSGQWLGDTLYEQDSPYAEQVAAQHNSSLLQPIIKDGQLIDPLPSLNQSRDYIKSQFKAFAPWLDKESYPISLDASLKKINN